MNPIFRAALLSAAQSNKDRVNVHVAHLREMIATEGQLAKDNGFLTDGLLTARCHRDDALDAQCAQALIIDQLRTEKAEADMVLATARAEVSDMQRLIATSTKASRSRLTASNAFALVSLVIMGAAGYLALFGHV